MTTPRFDLYAFIHKALRQQMGATLSQFGRADFRPGPERRAALDSAAQLLATLRGHLRHENDYVHTALEARQPGAARTTADEHLHHVEALEALESEVRALVDTGSLPLPEVAARWHRLYQHLAAFIGENLVHMQLEESANNARLWALYTDPELLAIHDRLMASIPPAELADSLRWMAQALSVDELGAVFADLQAKAPPEAVAGMVALARSQLDETRWSKLASALGVAQ